MTPEISPARRNIELKAHLPDLAAARQVARRVATRDGGVLEQVDTYFPCDSGRLKLREINGQRAELIWYVRPDGERERPSNYRIVAVPDAAATKELLTAALGCRAVVRKHRELFWHENVRIHLDTVDGLGTFLEFEAVLDAVDVRAGEDPRRATSDEHKATERLAWLREQFAIQPDQLIANSYGDRLAT